MLFNNPRTEPTTQPCELKDQYANNDGKENWLYILIIRVRKSQCAQVLKADMYLVLHPLNRNSKLEKIFKAMKNS